MVFLVAQWEEENSVSTISESKVVLTDQSVEEDLKEGMTVQVLVGKSQRETVLSTKQQYWRYLVSIIAVHSLASALKFLFLTILARGMIRGSSACFNVSYSSI